MEYIVEYKLKHEKGPWWYVQGLVRNVEGKAVRWSSMTSRCMEVDATRMYNEMYREWNSDPRFNRYKSGDMWRGKILP